jgi:transmembrane 9 superfamily protein 2/4
MVDDENNLRVVGVLVAPHSIHPDKQETCDYSDGSKMLLAQGKAAELKYTYSVYFVEDNIPWGTRWDHYLHVFDPRIHWFR